TLSEQKVFPHGLGPSANAAGKGGVLAAASIGYLLYSVATSNLSLAISWGCLTGWISVSILWDAVRLLCGLVFREFVLVHQDLLAIAVDDNNFFISCGLAFAECVGNAAAGCIVKPWQ